MHCPSTCPRPFRKFLKNSKERPSENLHVYLWHKFKMVPKSGDPEWVWAHHVSYALENYVKNFKYRAEPVEASTCLPIAIIKVGPWCKSSNEHHPTTCLWPTKTVPATWNFFLSLGKVAEYSMCPPSVTPRPNQKVNFQMSAVPPRGQFLGWSEP